MVSLFGMTETTGILTHGQSLSVWRHVDDEGAAIAMTIHLSKACLQLPFQCWDVEDGHVLLIEAALQQLAWVDSILPASCSHTCWISKASIIFQYNHNMVLLYIRLTK